MEYVRRLVTDEDDGQSYEERPDWAKAVSLSKHSNANSHADADLLTDLQEEALCIARSGVKDFVEIGEGTRFVCKCIGVMLPKMK